MFNILTIDLEEWFHANYHDNTFDSNSNYEERVVGNTHRLLDIMKKYNAKATFFVLASVAERYPDLILQIHSAGHEIASHGYAHQLIYKQNIKIFADDVQKSLDIITPIINAPIKGYRAPSWSITEHSLWSWEVLEKKGFIYSSSVFPIKTFLYGIPSSPRFKHHPEWGHKKYNIHEIPVSTARFLGKNIPFSGGFYLRALPFNLIKYFTKRVNLEEHPVIFYLHPREIDAQQPRLDLSAKESFIHYWGVKGCMNKLEKILIHNKLTSIDGYYCF